MDRTEYIPPIEDLNLPMVDQYTTCSVMNDIVELSQESRSDLAQYLTMLAVCDEIELPPLSSLGHSISNFVPPEPEEEE